MGAITLLAAALVASGCTSETPEPVLAPPLGEATETGPPVYDPSLPAATSVLALVPEDATTLSVTDFDQVRLLLGASLLTGESPPAERQRFWQQAAAEAPILSTGKLRPWEQRLSRDYGFTQDDVRWEATFTGPAGTGWVLAFREGLDLAGVERAVAAGVGPLAGAEVDPATHLVTRGTTSDGTTSWAADDELTGLVGPAEANATYVDRECIPFETAFAADVEADLAELPAADLEGLDPLSSWSVSFGGELSTARLGEQREDVFERLRLAGNLPATEPEFGLGYAQGVADPATGRIGYVMGDPAIAAELALKQHLPFAVCAD